MDAYIIVSSIISEQQLLETCSMIDEIQRDHPRRRGRSHSVPMIVVRIGGNVATDLCDLEVQMASACSRRSVVFDRDTGSTGNMTEDSFFTILDSILDLRVGLEDDQ